MRLAALLLLAAGVCDDPFPNVHPLPKQIAWGDPAGGLAVGLFTDTPSINSTEEPHLYLFVASRASEQIDDLLLGYDMCVLTVNDVLFTLTYSGGKMAHLRPGQELPVPICIPLKRFYRTDALRSPAEARWDMISRAPHPELHAGKNTILVNFYFGGGRWQKFARSGEVTVEVR